MAAAAAAVAAVAAAGLWAASGVAAQPASWAGAIAAGNMLYTSSDAGVPANNMPMIGNGYVATQLMSADVYVADIYNGYLDVDPSHRARIPATNAVAAPGIVTDAALDVLGATYYRRSVVFPSTPGTCTINATTTCSNAGALVWVEQRWYAHRVLPSVMVMEVEVLVSDTMAAAAAGGDASTHSAGATPFAMLALVNADGGPSADITFAPVALPPGSPYTIMNGSTNVAESNSSGLQAVAVLTTAWPAGGMLAVAAANLTYTFLTVIRTSFETPVDGLIGAVESDYAVAAAMAANGTLHSSHELEWAETVWPAGYETDRFDIAVVANTSLYALVSSIRPDRIGGICPSGLTDGYNGHVFWDMETVRAL